MNTITLPSSYDQAVEVIKKVLEKDFIKVANFNDNRMDIANLVMYQTEPLFKESTSNLSNISLKLVYATQRYTEEKVVDIEKTLNLSILTPRGDTQWSQRMKLKVMDGEYPSCVALDFEHNKAYLLFIGHEGLTIMNYGKINKKGEPTVETEEMLMLLEDDIPYELYLSSKSMFKYIDGEYGLGELRRGLRIKLNMQRSSKVLEPTLN